MTASTIYVAIRVPIFLRFASEDLRAVPANVAVFEGCAPLSTEGPRQRQGLFRTAWNIPRIPFRVAQTVFLH